MSSELLEGVAEIEDVDDPLGELQEVVDEVEEDGAADEDGPPAISSAARPAAKRLYVDQRRLIGELFQGFARQRELLEWMQELVIHSLGSLPDEWFFNDVLTEPPVLAALLEREISHVERPSPAKAREVRRSLAAADVLPAFHDAHARFAFAATERVDHLDAESDQDDPELDDEDLDRQYPAMRPALAELDDSQERSLNALLDGFDDEDQLIEWSLSVVYGSAARSDRDTMTAPYFSAPLRAAFLADPSDRRARWKREAWAAKYLLPAYNRAAAELAERASEVTVDRDTGDGFGSANIS